MVMRSCNPPARTRVVQASRARYQAPVPDRRRRVPYAGVQYATGLVHVAPWGSLKPAPFDCGASLRFAQVALFLLFLASNLGSFQVFLGSF